MGTERVVVFVCEHGSAKSVIAAAYFNKLAAERGLAVRAVARGTDPDEELGPKAVAGIAADGLAPAEAAPRRYSAAEGAGAARLVAFNPPGGELLPGAGAEGWDGVPPVGEDYGAARDAIVGRVVRLVEQLRAAGAAGG